MLMVRIKTLQSQGLEDAADDLIQTAVKMDCL